MQRVSLSLLILLACLAAGSAQAGCSSPAGNESDIIYNANYHTYQFCNGTNWLAFAGTGGGGGALNLISTQTASSSASLSWTGLTGTNYRLICSNIVPASNGVKPYIQFGEGGTPTWETASYTWAEVFYRYGNTSSGTGSTSDSGIVVWRDNLSNSSVGVSGMLDIFNLSASGVNHAAAGVGGALDTTSTYYGGSTSGYYGGDTNAITAIRLIMSSGNISSGTCSLYSVSS